MDAATGCLITVFCHFPPPLSINHFPMIYHFQILLLKSCYIIISKNHLFHIPYIRTYIFGLNPLHTSIEKDIAPVCYENNETTVTWKFRLLLQFLRLVPFYIDSLQILCMQHLIFKIVFLPAMHKIYHS